MPTKLRGTQLDETTINGSGISNVDALTLNSETNADLHNAANLTGVIADARIQQSNVTQHEAALSIGSGQITGLIDADTLSGQSLGVGANNIVQLNGSAQLPPVDGSLLTNLPGGGFGSGQTWQNVISSRSFGVTYTNTTGNPIMVVLSGSEAGNFFVVSFYINGAQVSTFGAVGTGEYGTLSVIIPNGNTYRAVEQPSSDPITHWWELR